MDETKNPWDDPELARRVKDVMKDLGVDEMSARMIVGFENGTFGGDVIDSP